MKKYSFLPILALVLGIAASAFTTKVKTHNANTTEAYFYLNSTSQGDENDLTKWIYDDDTAPTVSCPGDKVLCSVKAPATEVNGVTVIDENQLSVPIDMRHDLAVSEQQYQLFQ